ncbi:hypothetical protein [Kitasatospora sp. NPDC002040]|uniref:hypothetical protein n=1 Tax=Kitasatospora sp. NPDC002040 TaxID=3154661 RepID=UPI003322B8C2
MTAQTIVGLVGIVVLTGVVVAIVAVWRTGTPFPELTGPGPVPLNGPNCTSCGHSEHRGGCGERTSASGDIYDGGGDWVGYRNETFCGCSTYRSEPWPPCTVCGHGRSEHYQLLKCRHPTNGYRSDRPCPCGGYSAEPGPPPSYYQDALRAQNRRCPIPADQRADGKLLCMSCWVQRRCQYDRP